MATPRFHWRDPLLGALCELAAANASLSGRRQQAAHAREHCIAAAELVKRAIRDGSAPARVSRKATRRAR